MKRGRRKLAVLLTVLAVVLLALVPSVAHASPEVNTQVAFVIDGSGSIDASEWALMINATASIIEDPTCISRNGTVELTVIQFAESTATLEVPPTVVDSQATAETIADGVRAISKRGGLTPTGAGIRMAKEQIIGSPNFDPSGRQIINLITNGHPEPEETEPAIAIAERNAAVTAGIDEIYSEAVGVAQVWLEWLRDNIVYPEPGVIAPPYPDPPGSQGFVRKVTSFAEFEEALHEKCTVVFVELVLTPRSDTNPVGQEHTVVATHTQGGLPVVGEEITFTIVDGPHAGMSGTGVTDSNGQARWSYPGTTTGTDKIVATTPGGLTSNVVEKTWEESVKVPGVTTWGIVATAMVLGLLMPLAIRRRLLNSHVH